MVSGTVPLHSSRVVTLSAVSTTRTPIAISCVKEKDVCNVKVLEV